VRRTGEVNYEVVLLPGDGIGPEVMVVGRRVLERALERAGIAVRITEIPCGGRYYLEHGRDWPEGSEEACAHADVVFLGAVGWPAPGGEGPVRMKDGRMAGWSPVLGNRARLDLYANIRPIRLLPGVRPRIHGRATNAWAPEKVDLVIVRENTEGLYAGMGGMLETSGEHVIATDTRVITRGASERVIRRAFELSRARGRGAPGDGCRRVTSISKSNVLHGCRLFEEVFERVGAGWPDIVRERVFVDSFAASLMVEPERYDVCVTTNLFGDILTDLGAVLQGGMGMAVGCNVGDEHGMFEPVHGSAPALAGRGTANPMGMVGAVSEGLRWLGGKRGDSALVLAADAIRDAVCAVVAQGTALTADLVGADAGRSTTEVGEAIVGALDRQLDGS